MVRWTQEAHAGYRATYRQLVVATLSLCHRAAHISRLPFELVCEIITFLFPVSRDYALPVVPVCLPVDRPGEIVVTREGNIAIVCWDWGPNEATLLLIGADGSVIANNRIPNTATQRGVAVASDRTVVTADKDHLLVMRKDDRVAARLDVRDCPAFQNIFAVAFGPHDELVVLDMPAHRAHVLTRDGVYLRSIGETGTRDGQLSRPGKLAISSSGDVVISDSPIGQKLVVRIQIFRWDGTHLSTFSPGSLGPVSSVFALAIDHDDNIVIADKHALVVLRRDWSVAWELRESRFNGSVGVGVMPDGRIVVAEVFSSRLQLV